jgi:hypothetical protein
VIGLKPWEFHAFTPGEWRRLLKGYKQKKLDDRKTICWALANLMNAGGHMKKPVKIQDLMGTPKRKPKTGGQDLEALKKRFNKE